MPKTTDRDAKAPEGIGDAKEIRPTAPAVTNPGPTGSRDDRLDPDLDRERLEPGSNAEGAGGAGARPPKARRGNNT